MGNLWPSAKNERSSATINDDFVEIFKTDVDLLKIDLLYMINIDNGLLDALVHDGLLTEQQVEVIQEPSSYYEQISRMIETIMAQAVSDDIMNQFLRVLDQMQHKHVSNYVRGEGQWASDFEDYWPVYHCQTERSLMEQNFSKFIESIDSRNGLLDEMFAAFCITSQQKQYLESCTLDAKRNESLYFILRRGSLAAYTAFINCLVKTKQQCVASLLAPHLVGDASSVNEEQKSRLKINHAELINLLETKDSNLLAELVATECITIQYKDYIQSAETSAECSNRLLSIVERGSERDFDKFIHCLSKRNQRHVSRIMSEDGVVLHFTAIVSGTGDFTRRESCIADQFMTILQKDYLEKPILKEVQQHMDLQQANDVPLIASVQGNGIRFFYLCKSLRGLQYIYDVYSSGQLKTVIQKLIILIDANFPDADGSVESIQSFQWEPSNYINCVSTLMSLSLIPEAHRIAQQALVLDNVSIRSDSTMNIDEFPFELIEIMLIKAAGRLVNVINNVVRTTPRADLYALLILGNVSSLWWKSLTRHRFIKRLLKRYWKHICHPFPCIPKHLAGLQVEGSSKVTGVAELDGKLYIVCEKSGRVIVYESRPPFIKLEHIEMQELSDPCDIVVCNKSGQLYIADRNTLCAVWRVSLLPYEQVENFLSYRWLPLSLSIRDGRLLVTPRRGDSLFLHDADGSLLNHVELPSYMLAAHALESPQNTYVVCHYKRFVGETEFEQNSVTEVDVAGRVIRVFNSQLNSTRAIQLCRPHHLVLHKNHVVIADTRSGSIFSSTSDLQFKRILLHSLKDQPHRMCISESTFLFVSNVDSRVINVYSIS